VSEANSMTAPGRIARNMRTGPFLVAWAVSWALVGVAVAAGIVLVSEIPLEAALKLSVLFAEVVGFTSLVSARLIFPLLTRLPYALSLFLQLLTGLTGAVFGSIAVFALEPLLFVNRFNTVALIVLVNAALAVVIGIAVYTYDTMRRQLEQSHRELRHKEALDRELSIARDVQQQLLPQSTPEVPGLELAGVCRPAIGVGGDYFDFLMVDETRTGLVIADVSGRGIPAALLMAGLQASVRSLTRPNVRPGELNGHVNEILFRSSSAARYATMFLGFFDAATRQLVYSNAGHHPPLLLGANGAQLLKAGGLPIGLFSEATFEEGHQSLASGDLLMLFTDGVIEQPNDAGEEYGEVRLTGLLREHRERALSEIVDRVLGDLEQWSQGTEAHDDVTLVLARVR
jgi:serine phosphatase RsbU (regulator of sigma subunit)